MRAPRVLLPAVLLAGLAACGAGGSGEDPGGSSAVASPAAPGRTAAVLRRVRVGRFDSPVNVTAPAGDTRRVFVVEQPGRIRVIRDGRVLPAAFLDIRAEVSCCGEQGLFALAFAPDYARTGRFYVHFTNRGGDTRVVEYRRATADRANPRTRRQVLAQSQPEPNHNGGQIVFGPDGLLYVGLGDGGGSGDQHGSRGNGQSLGTLLGKILRIDPRASRGRPYTIPASNPFFRRPGARREIYAYGLRNPWRFSFDRLTGDLVIGDVGQGEIEEIDFVRRGRGAGANFGWRPFEGRSVFRSGERAPGHVPPAFQYTHANGGCSITGGYVVRDPALRGYVGSYLYTDFCHGRIRAVNLRPGGASADRQAAANVSSPSSFGEDARGRLYVTSLGGDVYRFVR
ncbi:MAG: PQQ-dependent sugar dehydrogenase [Solirubrobacteraceae bacterium]